MKYTKPKCKLCRRSGEKLFLKGDRCDTAKCAIVKKNYPPGMHGSKNLQRLSDYGLHLKEKQKLRKIYGLSEKQFKNLYFHSSKSKIAKGEMFLINLERRLDNIIYRLKLARSRAEARQRILHQHFLVNNKKVNIPSYLAKTGEVIKISPKSLKKQIFQDLDKTKIKPEVSWLEWNQTKNEAKILGLPTEKDLDKSIDMSLIVEYYSK